MLQWITSHIEYAEFFKPDFMIRSSYFCVPGLYREGEIAVGITISHKVGKAVKRNLLKRRIKSWMFNNQDKIPVGYRFNLIAGIGAADLEWQELSRELTKIIAQLCLQTRS